MTPNQHTPNNEDESQSQKNQKSKKQRITVQISEDIVERIKNAVYWTPGLTVASIAEEAFEKAVIILEEKNGNSFPKRTKNLSAGRPIK